MHDVSSQKDLSPWHWPAALAAASAPEQGRLSTLLLKHGSKTLRWYAPEGCDDQTPHDQDEIYLIASSRFQRGSKRITFEPGDVLFVPAGLDHRFVEFTEDFATWVVFYGLESGEMDAAEI
ncbi:cupin domain-containing protein [Algihabitans albus]|uniref:cupin domain-containing protein n=1 Tax=Algihabitans albus TaxID=2164067 RepID=UPI000E5D8167|nr:cupin domain-containing protein [Algihabitans albus]